MKRTTLTAALVGVFSGSVGADVPLNQIINYEPPVSQVLTIAASTCTVEENAQSLVERQGASLSFKKNGKGKSDKSYKKGFAEIIARCPLTNPGTWSWNTLFVGFQDPDKGGDDANVKAKLIRVDPLTGGTTNIARADSNASFAPLTSPANSNALLRMRVAFSHDWTIEGGAYYLELHLRKKQGMDSPSVSTVGLAYSADADALGFNKSGAPNPVPANDPCVAFYDGSGGYIVVCW
ncbi:MAG: hypothetical protein PHE55_18895 [Methylococcaceae bacterium]|nr:hypothetical protein [Methylococcaceae bacterium]